MHCSTGEVPLVTIKTIFDLKMTWKWPRNGLEIQILDIIQKHIKKLIFALVVIILIAWLVHASFLYGLKDLYFGSDKDSKGPQNLKVNEEIISEDSLAEDSSYDSILEYLVTDDYDSQENLMKSNDFAVRWWWISGVRACGRPQ